jgi:hypothetical protein
MCVRYWHRNKVSHINSWDSLCHHRPQRLIYNLNKRGYTLQRGQQRALWKADLIQRCVYTERASYKYAAFLSYSIEHGRLGMYLFLTHSCSWSPLPTQFSPNCLASPCFWHLLRPLSSTCPVSTLNNSNFIKTFDPFESRVLMYVSGVRQSWFVSWLRHLRIPWALTVSLTSLSRCVYKAVRSPRSHFSGASGSFTDNVRKAVGSGLNQSQTPWDELWFFLSSASWRPLSKES